MLITGTDSNQNTIVASCPLCGGTEFVASRGRGSERCSKCKAHTRTRSTYLALTEVCRLDASSRVLHFAPEPPLAPILHRICGDNYAPCDLNNERYQFPFPVTRCDLCRDIDTLFRPGEFDIVIHNHVLEHLPCNYTIVLQKLHALLRPGGYHIFSFPVARSGRYRCDMAPGLTENERKVRFGQGDHVRRFSCEDFDMTVGMVFGLNQNYTMTDFIPAETLLAAAIPPERWTLKMGPVFIVRK